MLLFLVVRDDTGKIKRQKARNYILLAHTKKIFARIQYNRGVSILILMNFTKTVILLN